MNDIVRILDSGYHSVITEQDNDGNDLGIMRRTLPQIMELMTEFFGATDRQALLEEKEELMVPYNYETHGTYDQFLHKVKQNLAYLRKHNDCSSIFDQYNIAKMHVQGVSVLHEAIAVYEYFHTAPAEQTYALLTTHLSQIARANPQKLTARHAINQVAKLNPKVAAQDFSSLVADEVGKALGTRTLSIAAQKRILARISKDIHNEFNPKSNKSCVHHPLSHSHSTEECRNPK